jgi:hypothetical protein
MVMKISCSEHRKQIETLPKKQLTEIVILTFLPTAMNLRLDYLEMYSQQTHFSPIFFSLN